MGQYETLAASPQLWLQGERPDEPLFFFSPDQLRATAQDYLSGFPGEVTYAVKANPHPDVLAILVDQGVEAFDVASPEEMMRVRQVLPTARLHYHNPIRSRDEIDLARLYGITSWSVDRMSELDKLGDIAGAEIAVRFKLPVQGAAYDFGSKFGAEPAAAIEMLRAVKARGGVASITFHPGTQCHQPEAWVQYIQVAADMAKAAEVDLYRLNVGGGFPAHRCGLLPDLGRIFAAIDQAVDRAFGAARPKLVCEPGRGMVAESFTLALRVKSVSDEAVFLNDGIYGGLSEWRDLGTGERVELMADLRPQPPLGFRERVVFGPTCDSVDRLPTPMKLPDGIEEGDYLLFPGIGAYSYAQTTRFNGYGACKIITLSSRP
ncbi:Lysine/ornithine decarboxylase [Pelagimonas phthalicica]|uniref:ornithine decarboxylase n=1 Tax=Pelagimonas phthalicica TaxID=1037362 RepID=A0A238JF27_9RHOB|nr:type III PLP-dependent enzyme [Pelagimonas phthalicica]TDS91975.1 ornithine decarboxylase [Pelagimonas phthalicica]SMX29025.1 Lysine/ornithine decarboxylase [Pelagimonas phthalicica]